jgi:cell division protein FtsB
MRILAVSLGLLILALQYPMWLGRGGWFRVRELDQQLAVERQVNVERKARNAALDADVRDLKQGFEAVEERARSELGMIRHDEVFFQLPTKPATAAGGTNSAPGSTQAK